MWVTLCCVGVQNFGMDLIPGDLRSTEVSFTPRSSRTYLSVVAGLSRLLPTSIGKTATSIDRRVDYRVVMKTSERT